MYRSTVWHFCDARNRENLETLNKRILRVVLKNSALLYVDLLQQIGDCTLSNKRIQNLLIATFKCLNFEHYQQLLMA